jgi:uncharacterized membrane-anchored protein
MIGRLRGRRPTPPPEDGTISGPARADRRTKRLIPRLQPGDIAVIDHEDIDRVAAEGLIQRRAAAIVNASRSSTGRYPNLGPTLLSGAGIPLIDDVGPDVMSVPEGTRLVIDEGRVFAVTGSRRSELGVGKLIGIAEAERSLEAAKQGIASQIERFAANTIEYIRDEKDVLIEAARLPEVRTDFHGRHVLIVVRGYDYREDLAILRPYIRELRPVLVGVDGGADALLEVGLRPHVVIGDMDSVSRDALASGAELVVHGYPDGRAPGLDRIRAMGLEPVIFEATGTSEDIAMILAYEHGAELIVAVGTHSNLIEFLDKGRKGMASTFLTRLRVGTILVDAKGVSRLYRSRIKTGDVMLLVGSALLVLLLALSLSEPLQLYLSLWWARLETLWFSLRQALL